METWQRRSACRSDLRASREVPLSRADEVRAMKEWFVLAWDHSPFSSSSS